MKRMITSLLVASFLCMLIGCSASNKAKGGAIGATAGGVVGGVLGNKAGNTIMGAIIGAAIGGAAGAYIGQYMDEQAKEIDEDLEGVTVERVGEGIKLTFDSGLLFDVDQANLRSRSKENLTDLARILNKYDDTDILIEGHTDATGPEEYNLDLSRRRAQSVSTYLATLKVDATRFTVIGYGEMQPIASNESDNGRQQNRRVDLAIMANEDLKAVAKQKAEKSG